jgi:hypothetical protein
MTEKPEDKQADGAARRVNENVRDARRSRRHETLMEFIARAIKKNEQQSAADLRPRPRWQVVFEQVHRAPEQQCKDGVFRQVAAFANDEMDAFDAVWRHFWKQPAQQRFDEIRTMLRGM